MKKLILALSMVLSSTAFAGFHAYQGANSLGVVNKLSCSTGLTCTKTSDSLSIVSSPSITAAPLSVTAASSAASTVDIIANNNLVNGDDWQIKSLLSEAGLSWLNNTSGSLVSKMSLTTAGNLSVSGTFIPSGAITPSGGVAPVSSTAPLTRFHAWTPQPVSNATSVTGVATSVYMTQIFIPANVTLTGVGVLNAATVGTNKYIVALFDSNGTALANSATAGTLTAGASGYQQIAFTATYAAKGPATYWVGVYINGTTDTYYSIPTLGQAYGLAGSVTGQTFGTVANVTLPTTFTAGVAPVVYVY